jgi:hypothetical protein
VGAARAAFAIFVDEGGYFRHRPAHPGATWLDWEAREPGGASPSVLWVRWPPVLQPRSGCAYRACSPSSLARRSP